MAALDHTSPCHPQRRAHYWILGIKQSDGGVYSMHCQTCGVMAEIVPVFVRRRQRRIATRG